MTLEQQIAKLAELGLTLDPGVTIDDLLYSSDRETYEDRPFDFILFAYGTEVERAPWGRPVCSRVWNFDAECISGTGDYVAIVKHLCQIAGDPDRLTDIRDYVDVEAGKAWLEYTVDGIKRHWDVEVDNDWADPRIVSEVMHDIERDGKRFYAKDNGQASIWFYLDPTTAAELNKLSNNALA